jgi:hypothetical protein
MKQLFQFLVRRGAGLTRGEAVVVSLSTDKLGIRLSPVVKPGGSPSRLPIGSDMLLREAAFAAATESNGTVVYDGPLAPGYFAQTKLAASSVLPVPL